MIFNLKKNHFPSLYIFFIFLSLIIFFFSTTKVKAKAFEIYDIEISKPFEINFDKNQVIDEGFRKAFLKLISLIVNSSDREKIKQIKLNQIKGMVESFSIKEEKFINEIYYMNLGVSFNKFQVFKYLEKKNIFPSVPLKKKVLLVPVIIDENKKDLLVFSKNLIFKEWNNDIQDFHLIEYVLPTDDLEDFNLLKKNFDSIEQYNFKEIINKYFLKDAIIVLIFKNEREVRTLSKILINGKVVLKNQTFSSIDVNNLEKVKKIIDELKIVYEDYWKNLNQINTSIKLSLSLKIDSSDNLKISNFEEILGKTDLIYNFFISKFDKDFIYYQVIFNGTPNSFLEIMEENNYNFDTQNKIWLLK